MATLKGGNEMSNNKKNYSKISTEKAKVEQNTEVEIVTSIDTPAEPVVETVEESTPEIITGVVTGCTKLNMRIAPKTDAKIKGILDKGDSVIILGEEGDFYKIGNPENPDYCMKKYISITK